MPVLIPPVYALMSRVSRRENEGYTTCNCRPSCVFATVARKRKEAEMDEKYGIDQTSGLGS
ncbi:MAG TPA: hypothetical protein VMW77_01195 [Methanoregula sp.]|nr:hypothetical protein [Methanoregula sp.]